MKIYTYDTTLRDGCQAEDMNLSTADKVKVALRLDRFGLDYIEGGWPNSNAADLAFFKEMRNYDFKHSKLSAFGSTHHPDILPEEDSNLKALITCGVKVATIVGKSSALHVAEALRLELSRNIEIIQGSIHFLKASLPEVMLDAEHFFDGYKDNSEYALAVLQAAQAAGVSCLVLCDTNGGTLPGEIYEIVQAVKQAMPEAMLGIHAHNDCELAVANSLAAVEAGARQVQGTINGVGERCGNANLISLLPILEVKKGYQCLPVDNKLPKTVAAQSNTADASLSDGSFMQELFATKASSSSGRLVELTAVSAYVAEVSNLSPFSRQPFVGHSAFAHKGGIHASAVAKNPHLYEHLSPATVGNGQRVLITELAGRSNIIALAKRFGFHLDKDEPVVKGLMNELKKKSSLGYDYAAAEASVELLILRKLARRGVREFFKLLQYRVSALRTDISDVPMVETSIMLEVEGITEHTAATGQGPVNAMDSALRKALMPFYPKLKEMRLLDFKVRVLSASDGSGGTASVVRVLIESGDADSSWVTVGVSHDILEASWQALADSMTYKLYRDECKQRKLV